ncbi:MAG: hypothetical protein HQ549_05590 [Candidatus Omnitrophica bacterium]|nr:hypothetical protein [Candidatus Omnitrophota bacterium]
MISKAHKKGFTLTELAFIVIIIAIFISLLTPVIAKIRARAKIINCEENLEKIGLGLKLYASEHEGSFPSALGELVEGGYVEDESILDCPSGQHAGTAEEPDYHYTTGYAISSPSGETIVFDKTENHKNGKHVLYISGDVVWE